MWLAGFEHGARFLHNLGFVVANGNDVKFKHSTGSNFISGNFVLEAKTKYDQ